MPSDETSYQKPALGHILPTKLTKLSMLLVVCHAVYCRPRWLEEFSVYLCQAFASNPQLEEWEMNVFERPTRERRRLWRRNRAVIELGIQEEASDDWRTHAGD